MMLAGSTGGVPAMPGSVTRHAEQLACGCCGSGGFVDVRWHVVAALRCLAEALELQGCYEVQDARGFGIPANPVVRRTSDDACDDVAGDISDVANSVPPSVELLDATGSGIQANPVVRRTSDDACDDVA